MPYALPTDVDERPVTVIGGGTLGRRIAMMFAAGGSRVRLFSRSADSREAARRFVDEHASDVRDRLGLFVGSPGTVELFDELTPAVATAWLIVESVSEDLALKQRVFRDRRDPCDELVVVSQQSPDRRRGAPGAAPERPLPDAARAHRGRAHVLREDRRRVEWLPLTVEVAERYEDVPYPDMKDPFDRIIVATAWAAAVPLVTADRAISTSGSPVQVIW